MADFSIERGVDLYRHPPGPDPIYPWRDMKGGDSFFVPLADGDSLAALQDRLAAAGRKWLNNNRPSWVARTRRQRDPHGVRVWIFSSAEAAATRGP